MKDLVERKMKVLAHVHMAPPYHNAGSETTLLALLRGLIKRGHEVRVICAESPVDFYEVDGVPVFHPPDTAVNDSQWFMEHYRWADVAITHLNCTSHAMHCARETNKPLVHLVHNDKQLAYHNVRPLRAQLLIFNSHWLRELAPMDPSIVVHPVVEPERFAVKRKGAEATILVNLTVTKGALVFYELARRFPESPFIGVLGAYGDQHSPPTDLKNLTIQEQIPDLRPVYAKTRVVLMPSDYESYGRVAVEAACSGIPSIVHPTPGLKEALGDAGIYIDRKDVDGWEKELRRLYEDEDYYTERSRMALEFTKGLKPEEDLNRIETALQIVIKHGLSYDNSWTLEALGEEAYVKKAIEGGYFNPTQEPRGYRPPLSRDIAAGPTFISDRKIYLDSTGRPVDATSPDKQVLLLGENAPMEHSEALGRGVIDSFGRPFYSDRFGQESIAVTEVRSEHRTNKERAAPRELPQVSF